MIDLHGFSKSDIIALQKIVAACGIE